MVHRAVIIYLANGFRFGRATGHSSVWSIRAILLSKQLPVGTSMQQSASPKEVVNRYIMALHEQRYEDALALLQDDVKIRGPAGESYGKPLNFIQMLRAYRARYDVKKVFTEGADVCVLYDLIIGDSPVYTSSWYQVRDGKIASINTIFDPSAMRPPPPGNPAPGTVR